MTDQVENGWSSLGEVTLGNGCRTQAYQRLVEDGHLSVLVGTEDHDGVSRWHLSISHRLGVLDPRTGRPVPGRIPTYEELKEARYRFCPDDLIMAQVFPPMKDFLNLHPTTLHLWEIDG